jgi:hypothetical protein
MHNATKCKIYISYQGVWHRMLRFYSQSEGLIVSATLDVGDGNFREIVDAKWWWKISGIGQNDAKCCPDRTHLHSNEGALSILNKTVS